MGKFYNEMVNTLEASINKLEIEADYSIARIETAIHVILQCFSEVKEYIVKSCTPFKMIDVVNGVNQGGVSSIQD